jgi:hypothetical protein
LPLWPGDDWDSVALAADAQLQWTNWPWSRAHHLPLGQHAARHQPSFSSASSQLAWLISSIHLRRSRPSLVAVSTMYSG